MKIERAVARWFAIAGLMFACNPFASDGEGTPERAAQRLANSSFEATDGNLLVNGTLDWANVSGLKIGIDKPTGQTDDSFGGGSKENTPVPNVSAGSVPNNKSDLTRFYVASQQVQNDSFLYLAWERANTLGSANMDFEFNQSSTPSSNGVTPVRTAGDILITFDFASGGNQVKLGILTWQTGAPPAGQTGCFQGLNQDGSVKVGGSAPCWGNRIDLSASGAAEGSVNSGEVTDPIAGAPLPDKTFGEAAINLRLAGVLDPNACRSFGRAFLKSRSSDSFPAELKDFIAPIQVEVNNCQPVTINLKKVDQGGAPLEGAVLQLFQDVDNDGALDDGDVQVGQNCTTTSDGIGDCTFQVSSNGRYIGHEYTAPNGYDVAADQATVVTMTSQAQTITLTFTDSVVPGRIDITKKDDVEQPVVGALFTLYADNEPFGGSRGGEDTKVGECTTALHQGIAICSFTNLPLGSYWVVETAAPDGYSLPTVVTEYVTIGLGGAPNTGETKAVTFTNPRAFKVVVFVCQTDGKLHPSTIELNGFGDVTSMSLADAEAAGLEQSALCSVTPGAFKPLPAGKHYPTVTIP